MTTRATADMDNVLSRMVSILGANPGVWADVVSGDVGAFPDDDEIELAALEADGLLITRGYFQSINNTLASPFMVPSSPIPGGVATGVDVPQHYGNIGRVELARLAVPVTANATTDKLTAGSALFGTITTGQPISVLPASGATVPAGLIAETTYYAIPVDDTNCKVAATPTDAAAGSAIDITSTGSGTFYLLAWQPGQEASDVDDVINAIGGMSDYLGITAYNHLFALDEGNFYTPAPYGRIETPQYTRTDDLQANEADETLIIAIGVGILAKNASPAAFAEWEGKGDKWLQQIIRDGAWQPEGDQNP